MAFVVKTLSLHTDIESDRLLQIPLPDDVPIGPAEVVVVIASSQPAQISQRATAADMAISSLFGLWANRTDLGDSLSYARKLRSQAERRSDG